MQVRQCIIEQVAPGSHRIADRVLIPCDPVDIPEDGDFITVRLLADGAGLHAGAEITVPGTEVVS